VALAAALGRWYAFLPWIACLGLVGWRHGLARAAALGALGWGVALAAEWGSTGGPGVPFGPYLYRDAALAHDWRVLGVPVFDSLSFTWLSFCAFTVAGGVGGRGWRRWLGAVLAVVAVDVVVDPVALRGGRWWLGRIYRYPKGGPWFGVTLANYAGWLVVAAVLVGLCAVLLRGPVRPGAARSPVPTAVAAGLLALVELQMVVLAALLRVVPAALASVALLLVALRVAHRSPAAAVAGGERGAGAAGPAELVVACALGWEASLVRRSVGGWRSVAPPQGVLRAWRRGSTALWLTGMGPVSLPAATWPRSARVVLVTGIAGGLTWSWTAGDLAVATALVDAAGRRRPLADGPALAGLAIGARPATFASAADPVDGDRDRARWAGMGADLVDMETGSWADWAGGLEEGPEGPVPVLCGLRAVVDTRGRRLGRAASLVPHGAPGVRLGRLLRLLLRDPLVIPRLGRLAADRRRAARRLGPALARLLQPGMLAAGPPPGPRPETGAPEPHRVRSGSAAPAPRLTSEGP